MTFKDEYPLATVFEKRAQTCPDQAAVVLSDADLTYKMLLNLSQSFSIKLAQEGVGAGSTLQLETRDLPVVMASLLASAALGARLAEGAVTRNLTGAYPVTHRIYTVAPSEPDLETRAILIDDTWSPALVLGGRAWNPLSQPEIDLDAPWLLLATSGTTGLPKIVGLTQRQVVRRSLAVSDEFLAGKTRFAALFPYDCRPFFARSMAALLNGATLVDRGDWDFWIKKGVNRVSGSLKQVKALKVESISDIKLPKVEVAGAKITAKDAFDILQHFEAIDDSYGATETSKSFSNILTLTDGKTLCQKGAPRDSVVEIVDQDGSLLPALQTGEVRVRNAYCATEYLFNVSGDMSILKDGYFYPGDVGRFTKDGALEILARTVGDVLNFDGVKLNAAVIDALLTSVEGIVGAAALQSPKSDSNEVVAFAEFAEGTNRLQTAELARKACADALGPKITPVRIWPINLIPRKKDGSPDREECANLLRAGIAKASSEAQ